jgi:hypothetical protein
VTISSTVLVFGGNRFQRVLIRQVRLNLDELSNIGASRQSIVEDLEPSSTPLHLH